MVSGDSGVPSSRVAAGPAGRLVPGPSVPGAAHWLRVGAGGEGGEVVGGGGDGEGDGFAAVVGQVVAAGDEVAEELEEAFGAALGRGSGVGAAVGAGDRAGQGLQDGVEQGAALGAELAAQRAAAVGGVGHGEVLPVGLAGFFAFQGGPAVGVQGDDEVVA